MNEYKVFYPGKTPIEIHTDTSYQAACQAAIVWNIKPSKRGGITVCLCKLGGKQVTHTATE